MINISIEWALVVQRSFRPNNINHSIINQIQLKHKLFQRKPIHLFAISHENHQLKFISIIKLKPINGSKCNNQLNVGEIQNAENNKKFSTYMTHMRKSTKCNFASSLFQHTTSNIHRVYENNLSPHMGWTIYVHGLNDVYACCGGCVCVCVMESNLTAGF